LLISQKRNFRYINSIVNFGVVILDFMQAKIKLLSFFGLIIFSMVLMSNRGGSPGGRTGSSTDGSTCGTNGGCHNNGNPATPKDMLSTNIPTKGYSPDSTYRITINATQGSRDVFGFEMMAEDSFGNGIGQFVGDTAVTANGFRATHKFASSTGSNGISWTTDWIAPSKGTGSLKLFLAVLATNNNQTTGGDMVLIDTLELSENLTADVPSIEDITLSFYPNPVHTQLHIEGYSNRNSQITIVNLEGKIVEESKFRNVLNVASLQPGKYILMIEDQDVVLRKPFVKF
jgi:hypothetical protein